MAPSSTMQPPLPRISVRDAKFATVLVGDEAARFIVHEELLTYHSPYFRAALKGGFAEAAEGALYHARLPNEDDAPELFELWEGLGWEMCGSLVRLYVFSDKYDVPALRRLCLNQLFAQYEDLDTEPLDLDTIVYTFKNAPSESPLCRFLIDYFCICAGADIWDRACESYETAPPLALRSSALQRYTGYYMRSQHDSIACDYHEHKDEEERGRCAA